MSKRLAETCSWNTQSSNGSIFLAFFSSSNFMNYQNVIKVLWSPVASQSARQQKTLFWSSDEIRMLNPSMPLWKSQKETPALFLKSRQQNALPKTQKRFLILQYINSNSFSKYGSFWFKIDTSDGFLVRPANLSFYQLLNFSSLMSKFIEFDTFPSRLTITGNI